MKTTCAFESKVLSAIQAGTWDAPTSQHLAHCAQCNELATAAEWMRALELHTPKAPTPDPDLIWMRAEILKRQQTRQRSEFLGFVQIAASVTLAAAAAWVVLPAGMHLVAAATMFLGTIPAIATVAVLAIAAPFLLEY